jgi:predicted SnoaL-like aldol condensation-catalyzing enzyme
MLVSDTQRNFSNMVSDTQRNFNFYKNILNGNQKTWSNGYLKISNDGELVNVGTNNKSGNVKGKNNNMKNYKEMTEEEMAALNFWIDQREAEAIAEQEHWDYIAYGQAEQEARREYFSKHPYEPYDSPDFVFERD